MLSSETLPSNMTSLPFLKQQILDSAKPKEFADNNFKFHDNGKDLSNGMENNVNNVFSKDLYCKHIKPRSSLETG